MRKILVSLLLVSMLAVVLVSAPVSAGETPSLTYWCVPNGDMIVTMASMNETPFAKAWQEAVGVNITFQHPPVGQETEQFNLMIAGQTLPDIIEWNWVGSYPGGAAAAIDDQVIIPLTDIIEGGQAPYLKAIYDELPDYARMARMDDGTYYCFPFMRIEQILSTFNGPVLRKDLLDEVDTAPPITIEDWHAVLTAFKEIGVENPLSIQDGTLDGSPVFLSAFNTTRTFYLKDGKVVYGPVEPEYKEFLAMFSQWYAEGLLDPEWFTQDRKLIDSKVTSGAAGAYIGTPDSWIGTYMRLMTEADPSVDMVGVPYPRMNASDPVPYTQQDFPVVLTTQHNAAITTTCADVDAAIKVLDYFYGDEGRILANYGVEGESYTMVDGNPVFTEFIVNNPDGLTMKQAMAQYAFNGLGSNHGIQMKDPVWQQRLFPCQNAAIEAWMTDADFDWRIPPITRTAEEGAEFSRINTDLDAYMKEMYVKFVTGEKPLDEFDSYVQTLESMNLARAIELQEAAYARYMAR